MGLCAGGAGRRLRVIELRRDRVNVRQMQAETITGSDYILSTLFLRGRVLAAQQAAG